MGFWSDKKVAVTGANGFIGSWVTEELVKNGANVTVLLNENDPIGNDSIKHLQLSTVRGDIRDSEAVKQLINEKEFVFHLAAVTQVIYGKNTPAETASVNVNGTVNLLEALRNSDNETFLVFASTDKVYGEPQYTPIDEKHPLSAKSPYDASKLAADRFVYAYYKTYGLESGIVRWSNTIGGRDSNFLRVVPDFVTSILNGRPPTIRGSGNHIRDYMHVTDSAKGILSVAENQKTSKGEVFNLGTEKPTSVLELANLMLKIMGKENEMKPVILNNPTKGEIDKQYLSSKKARDSLGWEPSLGLEESLRKTIDWYSSNPWWQKVMDRVKLFYQSNEWVK